MNTKDSHKRLKKAIIICIAMAVVILALPAVFPFSLAKVSNRPRNYSVPKDLRTEIAAEVSGMSADEIMSYGLRKTAHMLRYTEKNDLTNGMANCIGYAEVYAGICNHAFNVNKVQCKATPVVGYVMAGKINLCTIAERIAPQRWKGFLKDHDFVEFTLGDSTIYQDACIYDILGNRCRTTVKK